MRHVLISAVACAMWLGLILPYAGMPADAANHACRPDTVPVTQTAINPYTGTITTTIVSCHQAGGGRATQGESTATCRDASHVIPCAKGGAPWFASEGCYGAQLPDPPANSSEWTGHKPSDGHIWYCVAGPMSFVPQHTWFVPNNARPAVDPRTLAERAERQLPLVAPQIGMAPQPPAYTYVGLDTWLWIAPAQWKPLTMSAKAGPTSVRVTASPVRVAWNMGESTMTCVGPGRAWVKGMTDAATTDCSYTYAHTSDFEPGKQFPVSALIVYRVDWRCSGICSTRAGSLGEVNSQTAHAAEKVSERQTVVTGVS